MKSTTRASEVSGRGRFVAALFALLLALGCSAQESPETTGGETHFLSICRSDADCGGFSCLCGACSLPCTEAADCPVGISCTEPLSSSGPGMCASSISLCDAPCTSDVDCSPLPGSYTCQSGRCRASVSAGHTSVASASSCQPSQLASDQVALLGDSFFASTHEVGVDLSALAVSSGRIPTGSSYQDQSSLLDNALALGGSGIESQYSKSTSMAAVRVVVMTGGGADVLLGQCDEPYASCAVILNAVSAAEHLFARMTEDGVAAVVYVSYPDPVDPVLAAKVAALRPLLQQVCADSGAPCRWLDLRTAFAGHADYLSSDGINPSSIGSRVTAQAIDQAMRDACIAQ